MVVANLANQLYDIILKSKHMHKVNVRQNNGKYKYSTVVLAKLIGIENKRGHGATIGKAMAMLEDKQLIKIHEKRTRNTKAPGATVYIISIIGDDVG